MMELVWLVLGFVFLIAGANFLVDGSCSLARQLGVSDLVIGLTLVAFGTSAPEMFVNLLASIRGQSQIAIGNILGSNTMNTLLILGVAGLIYPLSVTRGTVWKEIPLSLLAAALVWLMASDSRLDGSSANIIGRIDGVILLCFFIIFLYYIYGLSKNGGSQEPLPSKTFGVPRSILWAVLGLAGLVVGANWVIEGAVFIAQKLGVRESVIGLTIVAGGTSLPELATSVVAAYKKNSDIAVGNVVGSNIFNIFLILGTSAAIRPMAFLPENQLDVLVVVLAGLLLFAFMFTGKRHTLDRWEAALFLFVYTGYIIYLIRHAKIG